MRADLVLENALVTWDGSGDPEQLQYGQILPEEGRVLRLAAQEVPAGQVIVEIGSYTGKSTSCLTRGSAEGHHVPVYAVDLWTSGTSRGGKHFRVRRPDEKGRSSKFHMPEVLAVFRRRMAQYSEGLVCECMGASVEIAPAFSSSLQHREVGLLFIDAEHTYEACRADFEAWSPKVVPGGVIAFHDYKGAGAGGVKRCVDEVIQMDRGHRWSISEHVGSLVVLENRHA